MNFYHQHINPDHNFAPGERHFLIPAVYKIFEFQPDYTPGSSDILSHEGAMQIFLRPGWWCTEHAYHTAEDMDAILQDEYFYPWTRIPTKDEKGNIQYLKNDIKPILILQTDNAANFSPKYTKVQEVMYFLFKFSLHFYLCLCCFGHFV